MSFKHIFQVKVKQHFLHEKGREQTLRRETWSTLLQITLRVFFMSKKHGNHKKQALKKQERVISGKKRPLPGSWHASSEFVSIKNVPTDLPYPPEPPKPIILFKIN